MHCSTCSLNLKGKSYLLPSALINPQASRTSSLGKAKCIYRSGHHLARLLCSLAVHNMIWTKTKECCLCCERDSRLSALSCIPGQLEQRVWSEY